MPSGGQIRRPAIRVWRNVVLNSNILRSTAIFAVAVLPVSAAHAGSVGVAADGLIGLARDERPLGKPSDQFSGGVLPSLQFDTGSVIVQADGMLFEHRKDGSYGGALHAGLKVGGKGFVGAYGSVSSTKVANRLATTRIGGEFTYGLGNFTLSAVAGNEHTERSRVRVASTTTANTYHVYGKGNTFFSFADITYKPADSFRLSVGHRYNGERHAAALGAGVTLSQRISAVFEGRAGKGDYKAGFIGFRVLLGGASTSGNTMLDNRLIEDLFTESNTRSTLLEPVAPPVVVGCGSCGGYCTT
jgi:hypothetical protein